MVVISSVSLPQGKSFIELRRDKLDEHRFKLLTKTATGQELLDLDVSCIKKLRDDFENDSPFDLSNFPGLIVEKVAAGPSSQQIAAFDHFLIRWSPVEQIFEVSSAKFAPSSKHEGLEAKLSA